MDERGAIAGVATLIEDERFGDLAQEVCRLLNLTADLSDRSGKVLFRAGGEAPPTSAATSERPVFLWGNAVGAIRVCEREGNEERAAEAARLLVMHAESILDAEYQIGSLAAEVTEKYEEVHLLHVLSDELVDLFTEEEISVALLNRLDSVLPVECGTVLVRTEEGFVPAAMKSPGSKAGAAEWGGSPLSPERGVLGEMSRLRAPILVTDNDSLAEGIRETETFFPTASILAVPFLGARSGAEGGEEEVLGAIVLTAKKDGQPFSTGDRKLVETVASQAGTAIRNTQLVHELKDAERMKRDMELAREIQESLLPRAAPEVPGVELAGRCKTAQKVGGDYYDYLDKGSAGVGILIGDVTGHDLGSALVMSMARSSLLATAAEWDDPAILLDRANRVLHHDLTSANLMISLFAALYEPKSRRLVFASGGHNPPLLYRAASGAVEPLEAEGLIFGVLEEAEFEAGTRDLERCDVVLFYTDGITEARGPGGGLYGEERLGRALAEACGLGASGIVGRLFEDVERFIGGCGIHDDITVVVLKAV